MYREQVQTQMQAIFADTPAWIEHTLDVLQNAEALMDGEDVPADKRELIAIVALLHDIGVLEAQRKHGSMAGPYQEQEGAIVARQILQSVEYAPELIDRVCYIVGHHHTPEKIDGQDFQIQWDADLLVNLKRMEIAKDLEKLPAFLQANFKTPTGLALAQSRFLK